MMNRNRREFLADVGKGMLIASVGPTLASDLGLSTALAGKDADRLTFSDREPLVSLMQDTPANKLLPVLVEKLKAGTDLRSLVAGTHVAEAQLTLLVARAPCLSVGPTLAPCHQRRR